MANSIQEARKKIEKKMGEGLAGSQKTFESLDGIRNGL